MKLLIWDFDGTLGYRAGGAWTASLLEAAKWVAPEHEVTRTLKLEHLSPYTQAGFPWHVPETPHHDIDSAEAWWAALAPVFEAAYQGVGFDVVQSRTLAQRVRQVYLDVEKWRTFIDTRATLDRLAEVGWTQVILSNHVPELHDLLRHLGLESYFAQVFNSADIGYEKPNVRAFEAVLDAFPAAAVACMVGDSYRADVKGAERAGVPAVLVHRYHPDACYYAKTLAEVPPIVHQMMSGATDDDI